MKLSKALLTLLFSLFLNQITCEYSIQVSSHDVLLGTPVTVSWNGTCSHADWSGCFDRIAPFPVEACTGSDSVGANTCYSYEEWQWVANMNQNSWTFYFDGPGVYTFRIIYCGCSWCNFLTKNFAGCNAYPLIAESDPITVRLPFDISQLNHVEQFIVGMIWYEAQGFEHKIKDILQLRSPNCPNSCFCDAKNFESNVKNAIVEFEYAWKDFSMVNLEHTMKSLSVVTQSVAPLLSDCGIDGILGQNITYEIIKGAALMLSGLDEVVRIVELAIEGQHYYSLVSNAILDWKYGEYAAAGVNTAKLINGVITHFTALEATADSQFGIRRLPNGLWEPCDVKSDERCYKAVLNDPAITGLDLPNVKH